MNEPQARFAAPTWGLGNLDHGEVYAGHFTSLGEEGRFSPSADPRPSARSWRPRSQLPGRGGYMKLLSQLICQADMAAVDKGIEEVVKDLLEDIGG
ncbi:hypothetical protein [Streptomyces platensis]|uniref:hypothetical protein n=1 Tax=Streptomyces platensis TaxID=58346 RepID=UPI00123D448A|nr:hypothetical protein [Streptomyces platensis]